MKIVFLSVWFSDKMGYIENCLPRAMAKLGHEVHIVTSTAQVYFYVRNYAAVYEPYLGPNILSPGREVIDGVIVHRLPSAFLYNKIYIKQVGKLLRELDPDVVQTFDLSDISTIKAASLKKKMHYNLYTANHIVASVFPPLMRRYRFNYPVKLYFFLSGKIPGMTVNKATTRCFPATIDALEIAVNYFGVSREKCSLAPLGVDTDYFYPALPASGGIRDEMRSRLGFSAGDIVCIYTGRFTEGKNPLCLARAIDKLSGQRVRVKGLFMGNGPQAEAIAGMKGCLVHEFVPYHELLPFYHMADIGIWPRQESTSMLDAAACGLPVIVSNKVQATERYEGNGLTYADNDFNDLADAILRLADPILRKQLADHGVKKIRDLYSWDFIAKNRIRVYEEDRK